MTYEYGKPFVGMYLGDQPLFPSENSDWKLSQPDANDMLWRYMSFAKFYSLLERRAIFFTLVSHMEDRYEGFIYPPLRKFGDPLLHAAQIGHRVLRKMAQSSLVSCWTLSAYESSLMWNSYAAAEGVAIRTTYSALQESIRSANTDDLPVTFGRIEYVNYQESEIPRFDRAPLYHKRVEYRGEEEVRAVLPGPPWELRIPENPKEPVIDMPLDPDVSEQRGRYIPVDMNSLVSGVVVSPYAEPWFDKLVRTIVERSLENVSVTRSTLTSE